MLGLFIMAVGITLMVKAKLGTSPISSMPYVFSLKLTSVSLGTLTFLWNIILILGQIFILGKKFERYQLIQVPISILFGIFVDISKSILNFINPQTYVCSLFVLIVGCVILAIGVNFTILADVVMNSGEAFVKAVTIRNGKSFGDMKVIFDVSLVMLSVLASFIFFGKIEGVREGTIIAAIISGFIIKFLNKILKPVVNNFLGYGEEKNLKNYRC